MMKRSNKRINDKRINRLLFPDTELLDELTILHNVLLHVVLKQALAVTDQAQQRATAREIFLVLTQVGRKLFDPVRVQGDLRFDAARVFGIAGVLRDDLGYFVLAVINCCHFTCDK